MVRKYMTRMKNKPAKALLAAFCLSASIIVPAQANDIIFLPDIPADQIAHDTVRSYDSSTGVSIATAPTFDPFEQDNTLAGTAALRSGPSQIAIDGTPVAGGAYLDLKMIYTSASDDPYDLRGYERAYYVSGDEVSRIHQDVRTLDCTSNTTEVIYEDNYYNSYDTYGYLAGVYLLLPRYRGHRGFWNGGSRYRPSASWSDWRRRSSYNAYGNYRAPYSGGHFAGSHDRNRGYGSRGSRRSGTVGRPAGHRGDGRRGGRDRDRDRETAIEDRGETTNTTRTERHNGRNAMIGGSASRREYRRQRGVVTGGPLQRSRANQAEQSDNNERNSARRPGRSTRTDRVGRTDRGRGRNAAASNTSRPVTNRQANPAGPPPQTIARTAPPATVNSNRASRTAPQAQRQSPQRSTSRPRSSRKLNREVDRSFGRTNRSSRTRKQMEFFPRIGGYTQLTSSVVTNYRCVREESVTLHIPQERLDAARFDGMTLVVVDNADRDVPIYLPPNYIEGFRQATGRSSYIAPSSAVVSPPAAYESPDYNTQKPNAPIYSEPTYQGGYPQN